MALLGPLQRAFQVSAGRSTRCHEQKASTSVGARLARVSEATPS
jgi:hypothetical protein